jgi:hypothetical protein
VSKLKAFRVPYGVHLIKVIILSGAFYTISVKIESFEESYPKLLYLDILFLSCFSLCNWGLEIFKWQTLVRSIKNISYNTALAESLAAHTTAIITPNKIGEYGAKGSFYKKALRKKILGLTFTGNAYQMLATTIFGSFGIAFFDATIFNANTFLIISILSVLGTASLYYLHQKKNIFNSFNYLSKRLHLQVFSISILRYLVFSFQYIFILKILGVHTSYVSLLPLIWLLYFISSCIPSFALFDFAIKGSLAIFVFTPIHITTDIILATAFLMWLYNYAIPAMIGGVYLSLFNPKPSRV